MNCVLADFGWSWKLICGDLKVYFNSLTDPFLKFALSLHTQYIDKDSVCLSTNISSFLLLLSSLTYLLTWSLSVADFLSLSFLHTMWTLLSWADSLYFIDLMFASSSGHSLPSSFLLLSCVWLVYHFPSETHDFTVIFPQIFPLHHHDCLNWAFVLSVCRFAIQWIYSNLML